ncbi:MAG TPA: VWA domain-containing protein [Thermoanaerobaculia bacterium]|nr:VWA domain-containing protein [Thermoanaerobaculia bacterium]
MRSHSARPLATLAFVLCGLAPMLAPPAAGAKPTTKPQDPAPSAVGDAAAKEGAFFEQVNVDVINVEVFVTDKQGEPIRGLKQEDFQIFEDGHPVAISNFYSVDEAGKPRPTLLPPPPVPSGDRPPGVQEPPAVPEEQRLYLILYVDNFNIKPFNRNRVFRRIREFLDYNVGPEDRVMLVTYNRSFKERVSFTSDSALVNSALFEIEKETGYNVTREGERNELVRDIEEAESAQEVIGRVRAYAGSLYNDTMVSIDAIKDLVASLGGLPGRKAILYVSDGLPMVAAEDMFQAVNERFRQSSVLMESREFDASRRFRELSSQANANRVTFYTIDAGGLRTLSSSSAERQTAGTPGMATFIDTQNIYNLQAPLLQLAEDTGGKAIINTNDVGKQLTAVAHDLRTYYSLGYQPAKVGDGRYHRIEVKVKGGRDRTLRVRHRAGYRDKPIEQRMNDGTMASLLFGELGNPMGLGIEFGAPNFRDDGHALVPVHLRIPLDKVTLIPQGDNQEAHLRAFIGVLDEQGGTAPVQVAPITIQIPTAEVDEARSKGWGYNLTLLMRRGRQKVAVGLRDDLGGTSSFVSGGILVR